MSRSGDDLLFWGGAAALVGLAFWKGPELATGVAIVAGTVGDVFARGTRLNHTTPDADGVIPDDPEDLRAEASAVMGYDISRDVYALARMGRSEGTDGRAARMHVALNDLDNLQATYGTHVYSDVWALMLHSKVASANGHFSEQYLGKRYATPADPYEGDIKLAEQVYSEHQQGIDPTGGALKFVDKDSFAAQRGATSSYEATAAAWAKEGLEPATVDGASDNFVVFRPA